MRGADCNKTMRAVRGSILRKSRAMTRFASSAMAPASSTPVGPPPTTTKVSKRRCSSPSSLASARSKDSSILARMAVASSIFLRPRREPLPVGVAVGVAGAGGEDQVIVGDAFAFDDRLPGGRIDVRDLAEQHLGVRLVADDAANRRRDVGRGQARGRHLVEERLEEVVVAAVDHGDPGGAPAKRLGRAQAAKARPDNDDAGAVGRRGGGATMRRGSGPVRSRPSFRRLALGAGGLLWR